MAMPIFLTPIICYRRVQNLQSIFILHQLAQYKLQLIIPKMSLWNTHYVTI